MLKTIRIDGYKCLVDKEIALSELSLIQGENGSGKTAILEVIDALSQLLRGDCEVDDMTVFPTHTLSMGRKRSRTRQTFELEIQLDERSIDYRLEVDHDLSHRQAEIGLEALTVDAKTHFRYADGVVEEHCEGSTRHPRYTTHTKKQSALAQIVPRSQDEPIARLQTLMQKMIVCGFEARPQAHSYTEDTFLKRDGRNFVNWYRHAVLEHMEQIPVLDATLGEAVAGLRSIRLERHGQDSRTLMVEFDEGEAYNLAFDQISDGEREAIVLHALLHLAQGQDTCLFLDNPIKHMELCEIQPWLVDLSHACKYSIGQAVLTSHHPEVIRHLDGKAIHLGTRRAPSEPTS